MDESTADDGAIHAFWLFILAVRARRHPPAFAFTLENVQRFREAVAAFEAEQP